MNFELFTIIASTRIYGAFAARCCRSERGAYACMGLHHADELEGEII